MNDTKKIVTFMNNLNRINYGNGMDIHEINVN